MAFEFIRVPGCLELNKSGDDPYASDAAYEGTNFFKVGNQKRMWENLASTTNTRKVDAMASKTSCKSFMQHLMENGHYLGGRRGH